MSGRYPRDLHVRALSLSLSHDVTGGTVTCGGEGRRGEAWRAGKGRGGERRERRGEEGRGGERREKTGEEGRGGGGEAW
jgi:hypothetical protein